MQNIKSVKFFVELITFGIAFFLITSRCSPVVNSQHLSSSTYEIELTNTQQIDIIETIPPSGIATITPKLSDAEKMEILTELVTTNGNCEFPCVWGISIGETDFYEAAEYLIPLAFNGRYGNHGLIEFGAAFNISGDIYNNIYLSILRGEDDSVFAIMYTTEFSPISEILNHFGIPDEIYYQQPLIFPDEYLTFDLALIYKERGSLILFSSTILLDESEKEIRICDLETSLNEYTQTSFVFWDFDEDLTFGNVTSLPFFMPDTFSGYIGIEKISDTSPSDFYAGFSEESRSCLIIDAEEYSNYVLTN
jgi:hypothetical protein